MKAWLLVLFGAWFIAAQAWAEEPFRVACVGDSITMGAALEPGERYPAVMETLLGDPWVVGNFGIGGHAALRKSDRPHVTSPQYKEALDFRPSVVVIMLGTNDSKPQNWAFSGEFGGDLESLAMDFAKLPTRPKIVLVLPPPVFHEDYGIRANVLSNEIVPVIKETAGRHGWEVVDVHASMAGKPDLFRDGIHPNASGAKFLAQVIADHLSGSRPGDSSAGP